MVTPLALSPPSPVLHALVAKVSDPRHTTADVVDIIRVDAGLTAVLLQLGNSPFFARSGSRVATVDDAVLRVGETEVIRQIAARLTRWIMASEGSGDGLARELLWRRSLMAAIAADELAEENGVNRAIAFTIGLLLDIGKLVIGTMIGATATDTGQESVEDGETRQKMVEGVLLGHSHAEIGAVLAEQWRLPAIISTAIRFHHTPQSAPAPSAIVDICHVADAIAGLCVGNTSMNDDNTGPEEVVVERLGLTGAALETLCTNVAARYLRERDLWS
jgi:putative nucleotidyltransferase with HDIG domain